MSLAGLLDRLPVLLSYHGMSLLKKQGTTQTYWRTSGRTFGTTFLRMAKFVTWDGRYR